MVRKITSSKCCLSWSYSQTSYFLSFEILLCADLFHIFSRNCPIDLKEAISSVIFASPRCADVPELTEIRKHFAAKYGKEFSTAAAELRPDCGVGRMVSFWMACLTILDWNYRG